MKKENCKSCERSEPTTFGKIYCSKFVEFHSPDNWCESFEVREVADEHDN